MKIKTYIVYAMTSFVPTPPGQVGFTVWQLTKPKTRYLFESDNEEL